MISDEIFTNGTRIRYFVNGTIAYLNFDLSVNAYVVAPTSFYSTSIMIRNTDALFGASFIAGNNLGDKTLY